MGGSAVWRVKLGAQLWAKPQSQRPRREKGAGVSLSTSSHSSALRLVLRTQPRSPRVPRGASEAEPIGRPGSTGSLSEKGLSNLSL